MTAENPAVSPLSIDLALQRLGQGADLTEAEAFGAMVVAMREDAPAASVRALLLALADKGEAAAELAGAVRALRSMMLLVPHAAPERLVDTCGTGGGAITTLNLSTVAAFVVAGAGVPVAKHGNRSHSSKSGSADVLEAMGIDIDLSPDRASSILESIGIVFLYAPTYHPAMRHVAPIRRELGIPTIMNLIGPLANPAGALRQVIGVADPTRGGCIADALRRLGTRRAVVVHGMIGIDEVSPVGETIVWEVNGGTVTQWILDPAAFGAGAASIEGLEGGEPAHNADAIERLLRAPNSAPAGLRSAVVLNAAAGILVSDDDGTFETALDRATASLDSGAALDRLTALRQASAG